MLDRLLVPLDGTVAMEEVLPTVRYLVGGTGAHVCLVAVRPPVRHMVQGENRVVYLDERMREERANWDDYLLRKGSMLAYDGVVVKRDVRFGEALAETLAAADQYRARVIAVAAQPQPWLARTLRPNLAQQLLAQSAVPVLAVPALEPQSGEAALRYGSVAV